MSSKTGDGLSVQSVRPITAVKWFAFTCMEDLYQTPTFERREFLMRTGLHV
jgi:hypothetical protein